MNDIVVVNNEGTLGNEVPEDCIRLLIRLDLFLELLAPLLHLRKLLELLINGILAELLLQLIILDLLASPSPFDASFKEICTNTLGGYSDEKWGQY